MMTADEKLGIGFGCFLVVVLVWFLYWVMSYEPPCLKETAKVTVNCMDGSCAVIVVPAGCGDRAVFRSNLTPTEADELAKELSSKLGVK